MSNGNHLLGAAELYTSVGKAYEVFQSWSYESTGPAIQDLYDDQLPVANGATGVYTLTFPSDKKPSSVLDVQFSFSEPGWFGVLTSYVAATGVLTVTCSVDANGDGTYAAAVLDELVISTRILCVK